jgi:hypothetical protein
MGKSEEAKDLWEELDVDGSITVKLTENRTCEYGLNYYSSC